MSAEKHAWMTSKLPESQPRDWTAMRAFRQEVSALIQSSDSTRVMVDEETARHNGELLVFERKVDVVTISSMTQSAVRDAMCMGSNAMLQEVFASFNMHSHEAKLYLFLCVSETAPGPVMASAFELCKTFNGPNLLPLHL